MIGVRITTTGIEGLRAHISNRANFIGGDGMRAILREKATDLEAEFKRTIMTFTPGPVQDLAESTKKQKQRKVGTIYPILVRTRQLIDSMFSRVTAARGGRGWGIKIGFTGSQGGTTNARIAEIHITGEGNMPKRNFTKIPASWKADLFSRIRGALRRM